jgi:hypothetical protein
MERFEQVPEEVQQEFEDSLDEDIKNWTAAAKKSMEDYDKKERTSGGGE